MLPLVTFPAKRFLSVATLAALWTVSPAIVEAQASTEDATSAEVESIPTEPGCSCLAFVEPWAMPAAPRASILEFGEAAQSQPVDAISSQEQRVRSERNDALEETFWCDGSGDPRCTASPRPDSPQSLELGNGPDLFFHAPLFVNGATLSSLPVEERRTAKGSEPSEGVRDLPQRPPRR